jgi:cytokinin riboside 5'-monophosphate phosphoribohydrolase
VRKDSWDKQFLSLEQLPCPVLIAISARCRILAPSMHERKTEMIRQADAFLVLPGAFGTLDEAFEVITLKQIGFHNKKIVFVNINHHWVGLSRLFVDMEHNGMIVTDGRNTFQFADDIDSALAHLVEVTQRAA